MMHKWKQCCSEKTLRNSIAYTKVEKRGDVDHLCPLLNAIGFLMISAEVPKRLKMADPRYDVPFALMQVDRAP